MGIVPFLATNVSISTMILYLCYVIALLSLVIELTSLSEGSPCGVVHFQLRLLLLALHVHLCHSVTKQGKITTHDVSRQLLAAPGEGC
jgi:hypothetical protein